jgi:hypothetical protein
VAVTHQFNFTCHVNIPSLFLGLARLRPALDMAGGF